MREFTKNKYIIELILIRHSALTIDIHLYNIFISLLRLLNKVRFPSLKETCGGNQNWSSKFMIKYSGPLTPTLTEITSSRVPLSLLRLTLAVHGLVLHHLLLGGAPLGLVVTRHPVAETHQDEDVERHLEDVPSLHESREPAQEDHEESLGHGESEGDLHKEYWGRVAEPAGGGEAAAVEAVGGQAEGGGEEVEEGHGEDGELDNLIDVRLVPGSHRTHQLPVKVISWHWLLWLNTIHRDIVHGGVISDHQLLVVDPGGVVPVVDITKHVHQAVAGEEEGETEE